MRVSPSSRRQQRNAFSILMGATGVDGTGTANAATPAARLRRKPRRPIRKSSDAIFIRPRVGKTIESRKQHATACLTSRKGLRRSRIRLGGALIRQFVSIRLVRWQPAPTPVRNGDGPYSPFPALDWLQRLG